MRIETNNRAGSTHRHYYQYSYLTFPAGTPVESYTPTLGPAAAAARQPSR